MQRDRERLREHFAHAGQSQPLLAWLHPSALCTRLHRIAHYLHRRGWGRLARFFWHLGYVLTGADLPPRSDIGGGLLIPSPAAVSVYGHAGRDLTLMPLSGIGGEIGRERDVGAGPGLPSLGDCVWIGVHAGVLGPASIGDGCRLEAGCIVTIDLEPGSVVQARPVRVQRAVTDASP